MPMSFKIDHENQLIILEAWGVLESSEVIECTRSLYRDGDWGEHYRTLVGLTAVERMNIDYEKMNSVAATTEVSGRARARTGRHALVASNDASFGVARMYEAMVDEKVSRQFRTFRSIAEAQDWLDEIPLPSPAAGISAAN